MEIVVTLINALGNALCAPSRCRRNHANLVSHPDFLPEVTVAIRQVMDAVQTGTPLNGQKLD
ncbi:MAG: hypothetical protein PVH03_13235 [Chloroflexota bacterium]|jgi:hypothetical protein